MTKTLFMELNNFKGFSVVMKARIESHFLPMYRMNDDKKASEHSIDINNISDKNYKRIREIFYSAI